MQNKQMASAPICQPGALLLGDAFNMRHPLTGGGMTVALSDTKLLCDMLQPVADFTDPNVTAAATRSFFKRRKPYSATINTLANALYKVFCSTGAAPQEEMRQVRSGYLLITSVLLPVCRSPPLLARTCTSQLAVLLSLAFVCALSFPWCRPPLSLCSDALPL